MAPKGATRAWDPWRTIEDSHVLQDTSLRYDIWTTLYVIGILAVYKKPDETDLTTVPRMFAMCYAPQPDQEGIKPNIARRMN